MVTSSYLASYVEEPPVEQPPPASPPPADTTYQEPAPAPAPEGGAVQSAYLASYQEPAPAPQEAAPQQTQSTYYASDAQAAPQEPVDKGYVPGTNAVVDTAFNVGNAIGAGVEAVGGKEMRDNLAGFAPPVKEIAEADGIKDKLLTAAGYWDRPAQESQTRLGQEAVDRLDGASQPEPSYNLASPEGLATAGQQFLDQLGSIKDHPEDALYEIAGDAAETGVFNDQGITSVLGQVKDDPTKIDDFLTGQLRPEGEPPKDAQGFYDWADAHPDRVEANRSTPENLYQEYLTDIGQSWEEGGLTGTLKGMASQSLTDPLLPVSLGVGTALGTTAKGLSTAGKVGAARGVSLTEKGLQTALGGPEDLLIDTGVSSLGKLVPQPVKSLFQPGEEGQRVIGAQQRREVGTDLATTRQAAGFPANRLGTPYQTTPLVPTDFGPRKKPSTSVWAFDPAKGITRDGNVPTLDDLRDVRAELLDMRPGEVHGFDQADLAGMNPADPRHRAALMRGALTQGITRTKAGKTVKQPFFVDDYPLSPGFTGPGREAAFRYSKFLAERIRRYGDEEVEAILRSLNNTKYRGKRGQMQPVEMWYDSMRQIAARAIKEANYSKPVDLGVIHRFDKTTGTYKPHPQRLVVNPTAAGKPLNIDDFEPDPALWARIQASAHPSSRITTPPPVRTPSVVTNAPPPPITTTGWKLPFTRKKPSDWALSDSLDEFDGLAVADGHIPYLRQKVGDKTFYRTIADEQDAVYRLLDIVQGRTPGAPGELDKLTRQYTADYKKLYGADAEPDFTKMGTHEANEFAATVATQRWLDSLPPLKRKDATGLLGGIKKLSSDIGSFRSSTGLYNWAAAPRQTLVQHTGNVFALLLTKPSAVTGMFNPKTAKAYFDAARVARKGLAPGQRVHSTTLDAMHKMGLGTNAMVADSGKNIVQRGQSIGASGRRENFESGLGGIMRSVKKIWAPDAVGDFVAIPDGMFRDAIISDFTPNVRKLQKSYPKEAASLAQDWVRGKGLKVPPGEVNKVVEKAFRTHFDPDARVSTINMTELENAIYDAFKHLPDQATTRNFANRVARDYKTKLNTQYQATAAEAKRIAFSWDYTRLDDALKHVFLYHYWASRATGLYAKQLLKNPWIAASYARLAIALNEEAEQNDYSHWMVGFSRLLSSPGGSILMANPLSVMGAAGIMAEWQFGMEPERIGSDITMLGRAKGIMPFMLNPLIDSVMWAMGMYGGEDAPIPMEPTGLERIPRDAIRFINLANLNGHLPEGMLRDEMGNPILLGERPLGEIWGKMLSGVSGTVRDNPQPIKDLYASQTSQEIAYAYQELMAEHPDWTEDMLTREVNRMALAAENGEPIDPIWAEAKLKRLEADLRGPEFQSLPEPLRGLFGGFLRNVSPMQLVNRPEIAMGLRANPILPLGREPMGLPEMGDQYDGFDMGSALYDTPEMTAFGIANEDSYGDPKINEASKKRSAIVNAENPDGEIVNGVHYSQQQIMDMTDARRYKLAREAMEEMGVTEAMRQSNFDAQRMMEENNPQLQEFKGYLDAIKNHPGGLEGFVDERVKSDPAFARAMANSGKEPGTPDWYAAAKWPETFMAASGERTSLYDPLTVPEGMDTSAYGEQRAADQAAYEDTSYSAKTERSVNEFRAAQILLNNEYPGYGYEVGKGNLPSDVWNHMREVWQANDIDTSYITKPSHYGAQYVQWVLANPNLEDTSVQAYLDATMTDDGSNKFADGTTEASADGTNTPVTFDLNGPVDMTGLAETFNFPQKTQAPNGQLVFPNANVDLRQSPGGSRLTVLAAKTPLRLLERNGEWALVAGPGGWQGWVPTLTLMTAA